LLDLLGICGHRGSVHVHVQQELLVVGVCYHALCSLVIASIDPADTLVQSIGQLSG